MPIGRTKLHMLMARMQLANALSQNCGAKMHRELASRSFTDAVSRLANDRVLFQTWDSSREMNANCT